MEENSKPQSGFGICRNKGFHMTFENGNTVSVQFGPGNYCDPRHPDGRWCNRDEPKKVDEWRADTAEVAAWDSDDRWHLHNGEDCQVVGWRTPKETLEFINFVATNELTTTLPEEGK